MSDADNKVFLITGASSGIGEATARHAAAAGYKVVVAARSSDKLDALAAEIGGLAIRCDVTEWADQEAMVERTLAEYGRLDVAFANAGFTVERGFKGETPERWRSMILTNIYGVALTIRACYDALVDAKGHLLLTSSLVGRLVTPGSLYSVTKFAVTAMGESARQELNGTGVRVTVLEPGIVSTPFYNRPWEGMLEADDIARAVMYAVSQPPHVDVNELLVRASAQDI
jgi:NADP-dependent 3-hydroxy acid dehydrogenase YdfG